MPGKTKERRKSKDERKRKHKSADDERQCAVEDIQTDGIEDRQKLKLA